MRVSLIALTLPLIFITRRIALPLNEAPDDKASIDAREVLSEVPSLKTLILSEILDDHDKLRTANPSELDLTSKIALEDLLSDRYPNYSNPATRARDARRIFSYFKGGIPIQAYLKKYGPVKDSSPEMVAEMKEWLDNERSPGAIFMMEKYSGMTTKEIFSPVANTLDMWKPSPFWVCAVVSLKPPERKTLVTFILGMDLDHAQLTAVLGDGWYSKFECVSALSAGELRQSFCFIIDDSFANYSNGELAESWHTQMMDPVPARRVETFESFGALPEKDNQDEGPQERIINHILGYGGWLIADRKFTEDQADRLRKAIFLLSYPGK
ncbi:hypothetical protein FRB93_013362 [Tulasnella sp. JGI-2019a]|nr:hypothetical protein FRB93_013362 [Tulasnella sp. JGI-2019a]